MKRDGTGTSAVPPQVFKVFAHFSSVSSSFLPFLPRACRFQEEDREVWGFSAPPLCSGSCPLGLIKEQGTDWPVCPPRHGSLGLPTLVSPPSPSISFNPQHLDHTRSFTLTLTCSFKLDPGISPPPPFKILSSS